MSGMPAARMTDGIICPNPQTPPVPMTPHAPPPGMPIVGVCAANVLIGGQPAARVSDFSVCASLIAVPNPIVKGAVPVLIAGLPAARLSDLATHPGSMIAGPCCPTVLIGLAGKTQHHQAGTAMCQAAAGGRASGKTGQSYGNCGLESSRQIINRMGGNVTEQQLIDQSVQDGFASKESPLPPGQYNGNDGGTSPTKRKALLAHYGIDSTIEPSTPENMERAVQEGKGVIVSVDAAALWPTTHGISANPGDLHAIVVTGVEYDDAGNIKNYIVNDTGPGGGPNCGVAVPAATMEAAIAAHGNSRLNVTTKRIH